MDVVNVRQLKNNPSEALRNAAKGPVLVMKGDQPTALIVNFGGDPAIDDPEIKLALAVALYRDGALSLGRAAHLAGIGPGSLIDHLSRLGIPVGQGNSEELARDLETLDAWLASS